MRSVMLSVIISDVVLHYRYIISILSIVQNENISAISCLSKPVQPASINGLTTVLSITDIMIFGWQAK